jgi:hypothetical protein
MINIDLCLRIVISVVVSARPVTQMCPEKVIDKWTGERGVFVEFLFHHQKQTEVTGSQSRYIRCVRHPEQTYSLSHCEQAMLV